MSKTFPTHIVGVACLVSNAEGEVLLVHNPRRGWEFPGGQVETGEDLITAVLREVEEEAGIRIRVTRLAGVYSNVRAETGWDGETHIPTKVMLDFLGEYVSGDLQTSSEHEAAGWFSPEQAVAMVTHGIYAGRLAHLLAFDGQVLYRAYTKDPYQVHLEQMV